MLHGGLNLHARGGTIYGSAQTSAALILATVVLVLPAFLTLIFPVLLVPLCDGVTLILVLLIPLVLIPLALVLLAGLVGIVLVLICHNVFLL
ncbi:MAG: hypothetical protein DI616_15110 [Paracoccus denitrificans]|uniref:Uncharacterized protein n=1 Tax=Paracoccus denitrificans TaxID=266 RepID=A0A533I483_PARDE|nr:MAG: hypothetical protein DI616_15110 [Paracoccus denitrificans]